MKLNTILTLVLLQLFTNSTYADKGGVGQGGGATVHGVLLDIMVARNSKELSTEELIENTPLAKQFLTEADKVVFRFSSLMTNHKKWRFIKNIDPILLSNCENGSPYIVESRVVACQLDSEFIYVDGGWFFEENISATTVAAFIFHEIYVGIAQRSGLYSKTESKVLTEREIQFFNGRIFERPDQVLQIPKFKEFSDFMFRISYKKEGQFSSAFHLSTPESGLAFVQSIRAELANICKLKFTEIVHPDGRLKESQQIIFENLFVKIYSKQPGIVDDWISHTSSYLYLLSISNTQTLEDYFKRLCQ